MIYTPQELKPEYLENIMQTTFPLMLSILTYRYNSTCGLIIQDKQVFAFLEWVGVRGISRVVATFNHVSGFP